MNNIVLMLLLVLMLGFGVITGYVLAYSVANTSISNQCNKFIEEHCYCSNSKAYDLPFYLPDFNLS